MIEIDQFSQETDCFKPKWFGKVYQGSGRFTRIQVGLPDSGRFNRVQVGLTRVQVGFTGFRMVY